MGHDLKAEHGVGLGRHGAERTAMDRVNNGAGVVKLDARTGAEASTRLSSPGAGRIIIVCMKSA